jgi:chromate transporter
LKEYNISLHFARFIQPIAVGFMVYAALKIALRVIKTKTAFFLMLLSAMLSYWAGSPWLFPLILLASGGISAFKFKKQEKEEKEKIQMRWRSLFLYLGIFAFAAIFGNATNSVAILLFENFYRNGSLIFGGGQVLIPVLFTEFVEFKKYLTAEEFLSGYGVAQALPGPSFAFVAFIGALSMMKRSSLANPFLSGSIGGLISSFGVFLPGALLIFFVIKFWEQLKRYRPVRASLEGINAASSGMVVAGSLLLFQSLPFSYLNSAIVVLTFFILQFTKIPAPFLILIGLGLGIILEF